MTRPGQLQLKLFPTGYRHLEFEGINGSGRVPRYKDVLLADLIDAAQPGEKVEVTGVYVHSNNASLNTRKCFFSTAMELTRQDPAVMSNVRSQTQMPLQCPELLAVRKQQCRIFGPRLGRFSGWSSRGKA